jgi:hypothetical protein
VNHESEQPRTDDVSLMQTLIDLRIAGEALSHSRQDNLAAIDKLFARHPFYTLELNHVHTLLDQHAITRSSVLASVASFTHCNPDPHHATGPNYISAQRCLAGLKEAAKALRGVQAARGTVLFATGHPGSLTSCYNAIARQLEQNDCTILKPALGYEVQKDWFLDYIDATAVISDTCGVHHTHMTQGMSAMLAELTQPPDLIIADHGFAAVAINHGIPCIAPMDTNDPGLALAKQAGADFVLVPMNDNLPNGRMIALVPVIEALMT